MLVAVLMSYCGHYLLIEQISIVSLKSYLQYYSLCLCLIRKDKNPNHLSVYITKLKT